MKHVIHTLLLAILLGASLQAAAEARREGGDDALRKAQYMLRTLSKENDQLKAQLAKLQAELKKAENDQAATDSKLKKANSRSASLQSRIQTDSDKFRELMSRYSDTNRTLQQAHRDNRILVQAVQEREAWIEQCHGRNDDLFAANTDLLQRYEDVAGRKKSDPITGFGRVRVENETQEYRFRLEDLQVTKFTSSVDVNAHARSIEAETASVN